MKFSEFRTAMEAPVPTPPKITVFIPAMKGTAEFMLETHSLRAGKCPVCGSKVEVNTVAKTGDFFGCVKFPFHYYFRESIPKLLDSDIPWMGM